MDKRQGDVSILADISNGIYGKVAKYIIGRFSFTSIVQGKNYNLEYWSLTLT